MSKTLTCILATIFILGSEIALASPVVPEDAISVVAESGYHCVDLGPVSGPHTAYLIMYDCSSPGGVHGWECRITTEGSGVITAAVPVGQAIDADMSPLGFAVGLAAPLPYENRSIELMQITYYVYPPEYDIMIYLDPIYSPSQPGQMVYVDGDDIDLVKPMNRYIHDHPRWTHDFVFGANVGCWFVPTKTSSWTAIRNLYR